MWLTIAAIWLCPVVVVFWIRSERAQIRKTVQDSMLFGYKEDQVDRKPFRTRLAGSIANIGRAASNDKVLMSLQDRINAAGNPWHMSAEELTGLKLVAGFGGAITFGYVFYVVTDNLGSSALLAIALIMITQIMPSFALSTAVKNRKQSIEEDLPDFVDVVTLIVEAGLGLDGAMALAAKQFSGPISQEFTYALRDIQYGIPKRVAFLAIAERNKEITTLGSILAAIVQAEKFGMSMASIMRVQSEQLRQDKKHRTEEKVQKLPLKILFPLIFLIMPSLFIAILGPAIISIMQSGAFK